MISNHLGKERLFFFSLTKLFLVLKGNIILLFLIFFSEHSDEELITFPSDVESTKNLTAPNDDFIAYNNVPMSVAHYKRKIIITVPRRAPGIPSTLNYVDADLPKGSSPALRPYPNFETNQLHVRGYWISIKNLYAQSTILLATPISWSHKNCFSLSNSYRWMRSIVVCVHRCIGI